MSNEVSASLEDGMVKTVFVPTIKDVKAPTVAELTGEGVLDMSMWLTGDGFQATHGQNMIDDDREGSAEVGQIPGRETWTDTLLRVVDNINRVDDSNKAIDNTLVETLTRGKTGYFVRRRGLPSEQEFAAGQKVSVLPVTIGIKTPVAHAVNQRQLSQITFSVSPGAQDETATVAAGSGALTGTHSHKRPPHHVAWAAFTIFEGNPMLPTIKRPTGHIEIVTDLDTLNQSRELAKQLEQLEAEPTTGLTEKELSTRATNAKKLRKQLEQIVRDVREHTLILDVQGLNASLWEQLVAANTTTENGATNQDVLGLIRDAVATMTTGAHMQPTPDESLEFDKAELFNLLADMPDSQLFAMMPIVQQLNTPAIALPKA